MNKTYPLLTVDTAAFRSNVREIVTRNNQAGIRTAAVIKGYDGLIPLARICREEGSAQIATSRLEQVEACRNAGIEGPYLLLRVPMQSELSDLVSLCEYSLQSDLQTMVLLNRICIDRGVTHKVVVMADLGDLREGYWDHEEMVRDCLTVERDMAGLELAGVGVNLGCYGAIEPTTEKMEELLEIARRVEEGIGRKLEIVSGGATTSFILVHKGIMPKGINHLRIGEAIEQPLILTTAWGLKDIDYLSKRAFTLQMQVIEVKDKPTKPVGHSVVDPFEGTPDYPDLGIRKRALLAGGRADYGHGPFPIPRMPGVKFVGASSDHTIIDVEECEEVRVGDVLEFDVTYSALIYLSHRRDVWIEYR